MKPSPVCACLASLGYNFGQPAPDGPRFEVASINASDPNPSNPMFIGMSADGAIVNYTNITCGIASAGRTEQEISRSLGLIG